VTVYEWCELGNRVRVHAGSVIGADGFGYAPRRQGAQVVGHQKIYHLGKVVIGDDCEIGANSCVDRATFGETWLGREVKIDNQVQVGHNVRIDDGAVICGGTGLAGNSKIGKFALVLGNVGVANQVSVGDGARVAAHTCVSKDVAPGATVAGYPQRDFKEHFRIQALLNKLLEERKSRVSRAHGASREAPGESQK
jgi:UDP-3-O-[3-hydroxymyristoyl] glucosamine N-acyltransferase